MSETLTDSQIRALKVLAKRLLNPRARPKPHERFISHEYNVESLDGHQRFRIYKRQSLADQSDFSTGILWERRPAVVTLARYNGSSHEHTNHLEGDHFSYVCHIHEITERYQLADRKPESFAVETSAYSNLDGAFRLLLQDWNITLPSRGGGTASNENTLL
jgi:hypothetical protein